MLISLIFLVMVTTTTTDYAVVVPIHSQNYDTILWIVPFTLDLLLFYIICGGTI